MYYLGSCKNNLARYKNKQHDLRLFHTIDQTREYLRFILLENQNVAVFKIMPLGKPSRDDNNNNTILENLNLHLKRHYGLMQALPVL